MGLDGSRGVVVQHWALRTDCRTLDVLPGQAAVRQQHHPRTSPGLDHQPAAHNRHPLVRIRLLLQRAGTDVRSDQLVSWPHRDHWKLEGSRPNLASLPVQLPRGQRGRDMRPAEGPAAAKSEVEAEGELVRPFSSKAEISQKGVRAELRCWPGQRIDVRDFDSAESGVGHRCEFAIQLGSTHRRAEPPPTHHRCRARRWVGKLRAEITDSQAVRCLRPPAVAVEKALSSRLR